MTPQDFKLKDRFRIRTVAWGRKEILTVVEINANSIEVSLPQYDTPMTLNAKQIAGYGDKIEMLSEVEN